MVFKLIAIFLPINWSKSARKKNSSEFLKKFHQDISRKTKSFLHDSKNHIQISKIQFGYSKLTSDILTPMFVIQAPVGYFNHPVPN